MHCSTPSATYSTCSTSTRGSWQIIPRMGRKKVDRWRHRAELVNQGATQAGAVPGLLLWAHIDQSCWRYFNLCDMQNIGGSQFEFGQTANQWFCREWMTARSTMLSSGGLPSNSEIAHVCALYASSFPAWKRTYHDLPWLTDCSLQYKVVRGWSARTNISKSVVGSWSSVPLGRNGCDACFELLVHLNPLQQGALRTGDARDA